jgi:hypothetical protein
MFDCCCLQAILEDAGRNCKELRCESWYMRIWDLNPGYLNRQSLLGEHRELHGMINILRDGKKGYSRHPETLRWVGCEWALRQRHQFLSSEMELRGYNDRSPVEPLDNDGPWPDIYIDLPYEQLNILSSKYVNKEPGRIRIPQTAQEFWGQHKYSVMARSMSLYQAYDIEAAGVLKAEKNAAFIQDVTELLRVPPSPEGLRNTLQQMWGHVSDVISDREMKTRSIDDMSDNRLYKKIRDRVKEAGESDLWASTALGELGAWTDDI